MTRLLDPNGRGGAEASPRAGGRGGDASPSPRAWLAENRVVLGAIAAVLVIWLAGAAVTKYSLQQMAFFAPIAVVVVGATVGVVLLWVKIAVQVRAERRARHSR